jgi:beta-ureidopropionase
VTIRVGQVRAVPLKGGLAANHATLMALLEGVAGERLDAVVTPECFLDGYVATEAGVTARGLRDYAVDPATSSYLREARQWSRRAGSWLVWGCSRLGTTGVRNSALLIDRAGELAGVYDKTHLQTHDLKFEAGTELPVFPSDFGPFGVMICADRRWPETTRTLALRGARIVFNPTYGMHDEMNLAMMRTRSYESELFVVFTHPRQSLVTGPRGEVLRDEREPEVDVTVTEVDLAAVEGARSGPSAHLRDRRPGLYCL